MNQPILMKFGTQKTNYERNDSHMSVRLSVCPSVCHSHTPVFCLNGYTYPHSFFHHRIAPSFWFIHTKRDGNIGMQRV